MKFEQRNDEHEKEIRLFADLELRTETIRSEGDDTDSRKIIGHAAVFDKPTRIGWYLEEVAPGAFIRTIKDSDIRALFNHDPNYPLGRNRSGTLKLQEDERGLKFEISPPDTQYARDVMQAIDRQDVTGASFGFYVRKQQWSEEEQNGKTIIKRRLLDIELFDVSPVTFPAYKETDVALRSVEDSYNEFKKQQNQKSSEEIQLNLSMKKRELEIIEQEV